MVLEMNSKRTIAIDIALQTCVLRICKKHQCMFLDDTDPAPAFELALELLHAGSARVAIFKADSHELTDLMCDVMSEAPVSCPQCRADRIRNWECGAVEFDTPQPA